MTAFLAQLPQNPAVKEGSPGSSTIGTLSRRNVCCGVGTHAPVTCPHAPVACRLPEAAELPSHLAAHDSAGRWLLSQRPSVRTEGQAIICCEAYLRFL